MSRTSDSGAGRGPSLSRRAVLRAGTVGAAAMGAATAFPGLLSGAAADGPELSGAASEGAAAAGTDLAGVEGPIVAHITDASAGELSLYVGEREIMLRDPSLVRSLIRSAR